MAGTRLSCTSTPTSIREKHRRGESDSGSLIPWWSRIPSGFRVTYPVMVPSRAPFRQKSPGDCTRPRHLCSQEHKQAVFVLPDREHKTSSICAPWSRIKQYVCSREHTPAIFVVPGAQKSSICARSTIKQVAPRRPQVYERNTGGGNLIQGHLSRGGPESRTFPSKVTRGLHPAPPLPIHSI